jgi:hypothetical protein
MTAGPVLTSCAGFIGAESVITSLMAGFQVIMYGRFWVITEVFAINLIVLTLSSETNIAGC